MFLALSQQDWSLSTSSYCCSSLSSGKGSPSCKSNDMLCLAGAEFILFPMAMGVRLTMSSYSDVANKHGKWFHHIHTVRVWPWGPPRPKITSIEVTKSIPILLSPLYSSTTFGRATSEFITVTTNKSLYPHRCDNTRVDLPQPQLWTTCGQNYNFQFQAVALALEKPSLPSTVHGGEFYEFQNVSDCLSSCTQSIFSCKALRWWPVM
jgi:hypothetical protein